MSAISGANAVPTTMSGGQVQNQFLMVLKAMVPSSELAEAPPRFYPTEVIYDPTGHVEDSIPLTKMISSGEAL